MPYIVTLVKVSSTHNNLRTTEVEGVAPELPQQGKEFQLTGAGLEYGARLVNTTPVVETTLNAENIEFRTLNSKYLLRNIKEVTTDEVEQWFIKNLK